MASAATSWIKAALWAGAGAALAALTLELRHNDGASADAPSDLATSAAEPANTAPTSTEGPPVAVVQERAQAVAAPNRTADRTVPVAANNPIVANAPPSNSPGTHTDLPNRRNDDASGASPAADLLDSPRISCDFRAGNNTGIRLGDTLTVGGGAQWQGGLILYDFIGAGTGTARMTGSPSVTGSPSGEAKVEVRTEGTRLFLSGFLENSAFVVVTIFDELDNVGRHIAVMSRHEPSFSYASQFLGTCE